MRWLPLRCAALQVVLHISSASRRMATAVKLGTFFGVGTILATAFIHMLQPAAEALSSPCLPAFWRDAYGGWAFAFVTAAILLMHLVDYAVKVGRWGGLLAVLL